MANVKPRPIQIGKPSQAVLDWDAKYGQLYNYNGTPKFNELEAGDTGNPYFERPNVAAEKKAVAADEARRFSAGEFGEQARPDQRAATLLTDTERQRLQTSTAGLGRGATGIIAVAGEGVQVITTAARTGPNDDAVGATGATQKISKTSIVEFPESPLANPLNNYPNYTYNISLHAVPINKYNRVVANGADYATNDETVLIASGGRNNSTFSRNPRFANSDLYFDSLKLKTVIGINAQSRGSNVYQVEFSIVEPISMTLLKRLLEVATDYDVRAWDQLPLMLQIDFFANDNQGTLTDLLAEHSKRIVIKLIQCKIKVDSRGTVYTFSAVPTSQTAFMQNTATTPAIFEVLAETVGDFFDATRSPGDVTGILNSQNSQRFDPASEAGHFGEEPKKFFKTYSYAAAMNQYQKKLEETDRQDYADTYEFILDQEIAKSKIIYDKKINTSGSVPMQNNKSNSGTVNTAQELVRINAGSSMLDVINQVLRNSEYFTNLVKEDPDLKSTSPLTLFKILPVVEFDENRWDAQRMQYARKIKIYIRKYDYYNTKFPNANKTLPQRWHKSYNYIYTGQNQEILDLNIDFNTMFYIAMTERPDKFSRAQVQPSDDKTKDKDTPEPQSGSIHYVRQAAKTANAPLHTGQGSTEDSKVVRSNDLYKNIFSGSAADMIQVRMRISGDPHMIKQDELFFTPLDSDRNKILNKHNSLNMDVSEIFCYLNFKLPDDYVNSTGMVSFGDYDGSNEFNGIYRILTVDNEFARGQFTQDLTIIKLFGQDTDKTKSARQITKDNLKNRSAVADNKSQSPQTVSGQTAVAAAGTTAQRQMSEIDRQAFLEANQSLLPENTLTGTDPRNARSYSEPRPDSRRTPGQPVPDTLTQRPPGFVKLQERVEQNRRNSLLGGGGG